jgi:putative endonuclease
MNERSKHDISKIGENIAAKHLASNGYTIVCSNFRKRCGEIDIIVEKDQHLVFVEVKTRTSHSMLTALASVSHSKQLRITRTAQEYLNLNKHYCNHNFRFDVIVVFYHKYSDTFSVHHMEDAFCPILED